MSGLWSVLKSIFDNKRYIDVDLSELPSRGMFYPDGLEIKIKTAEQEDIDKYNIKYIDGDYMSIFMGIKWVVNHNVKVSEGHSFNRIASIDILFIFLEIVKLTKNKDIYVNTESGKVRFCPDNFNYFKFSEESIKNFDNRNKEFIYDGFKYSVPTVGAESSISRFLYEMNQENRVAEFSDCSYDFLYFLGGKTILSNDEIENLVTIFNDEISAKDKQIIVQIIEKFKPLSKYTIKTENGIVPIEGIDLKTIWDI